MVESCDGKVMLISGCSVMLLMFVGWFGVSVSGMWIVIDMVCGGDVVLIVNGGDVWVGWIDGVVVFVIVIGSDVMICDVFVVIGVVSLIVVGDVWVGGVFIGVGVIIGV